MMISSKNAGCYFYDNMLHMKDMNSDFTCFWFSCDYILWFCLFTVWRKLKVCCNNGKGSQSWLR